MYIKGMIQAVNQTDGKYGILLTKFWFNAFGDCQYKKGDFVRVEYEMNGKHRNIKKIENK